MLADGDAYITDADHRGGTALLYAAMGLNSLPTLIWLLEEGGARITERDHQGRSALVLAALHFNFTTCQWLLEHGGADIADVTNGDETVWNMLEDPFIYGTNAADVTALLRVMVLKGVPTADLVARMRPEYKRVVKKGARLRAALPAYLAQRRALLDAHCPLIAPLRAIVRRYDEPTTTEELWATGIGAAPQRARRPRIEAGVALPVRRSASLHQRLG
jgi:hypothetical protein